MSDIESSAIRGFTSISTDDFIGFTDKDVANFEVLIQALYDHKQTQKAIALRSKLLDHVRNGTHEFHASDYAEEIIASLYNTYRDTGYTGSVSDMLLAIVKDIEVGDMDDVRLGINRYMALHTKGWQYLMRQHEAEDKAHYALYRQYHPSICFDSPVEYHINPLTLNCLPDGKFTLDTWNNDSGTIFFDFDFDVELGEQHVCDFVESDGTHTTVLIRPDRKICLRHYSDESVYEDLPSLTHELLKGRCRCILTRDGETLHIRDELNYSEVNNVFQRPEYLKLIPSTGVTITSIVGYRHTASPAEQAFLLN